MEFIQFHPTCLYHPHAKSFLISEAVRGEGGLLLLPGRRASCRHDPRAELAPRDVVARAIDFEMKKHGLDCVHLDISHQSPEFLHSTFPTSWRAALAGHRHHQEPIPVVPGPLHLRRRADRPVGPHRPARPVRRGRWPAPACTAPTAWPATRCSNAWCLRAAAQHIARRRAAVPALPAGTTAA
jgi:hypothetical protein